MTDNATQTTIKQDLVVKRIIDVPLEVVWRAWTDPELVMRWWGPQYYTSPSARTDLREGGRYIFGMRAPEDQGGQVSYIAGVYKKILPMERLEFTQSVTDKDGHRMDPTLLGMPPDLPEVIDTAVVFRAKGDMTELTITEYDWTPGPMMVYSLAGLHQMIDKLAEAFGKEL